MNVGVRAQTGDALIAPLGCLCADFAARSDIVGQPSIGSNVGMAIHSSLHGSGTSETSCALDMTAHCAHDIPIPKRTLKTGHSNTTIVRINVR